MENVESFVFYRSFYESIKMIEDNEIKNELYNAICEYALNGVEIEVSNKTKPFFILIKPQLDANYERMVNSKKGGAPKGNQNAKKEKQPKVDSKKQPKQPMVVLENQQKQPNKNNNYNLNNNYNNNSNDNLNVSVSNSNNTPTLEQVTEYINLNNYSVDPKKFYSCYQSKGWKGITDWKAKIDYWQYEDKKSNSTDFNDLDW